MNQQMRDHDGVLVIGSIVGDMSLDECSGGTTATNRRHEHGGRLGQYQMWTTGETIVEI